MRTRTKLTTPPGSEPAPLADVGPTEIYSPGLTQPVEPRCPSRFRRVLTALVTLVVVAALGWLAFRLVTTGQADDPSLQFVPDETTTSSP
ncbi:MAG: hypothetical protein ACRDUY_08970 [Nitriliruptorales bacterium]